MTKATRLAGFTIRHRDQAAAIVHQAAVRVDRDDLALGKGDAKPESKRQTEPHIKSEKVRALGPDVEPKRRVRRQAGDRKHMLVDERRQDFQTIETLHQSTSPLNKRTMGWL